MMYTHEHVGVIKTEVKIEFENGYSITLEEATSKVLQFLD